MNSIETQVIAIEDNNKSAKAYINFADKSLLFSIVSDTREQYDFTINPQLLKTLAYGYNLHCEECDKGGKE